MSVAPAYLVLGDDATLRAEGVRALVAEIMGDDDPSLGLEDFTLSSRPADAPEPDGAGGADPRPPVLASALQAASTPPFGTRRRVVVLREVGVLAAADVEAVGRWLADPLETTVMVLVAGGGRVPAALTRAVKSAGGREVRTGSESTGEVLGAALQRSGVALTPAATRRVTEWLGNDAGRIPGLVDLLRSTYGEGATVDAGEVEPYLGAAGSMAPYHLTGAIDAGEVDVALDVLHRLRGAGFHPLQIMVLLHRHYQRLLRLDDPALAGEADAVAALGGKVKPYPAGLALRQARLLGTSGLRVAYGALAKADVDLRGATAAPEDAVLEILVARLSGLSRRSGAGGGHRPAGSRRRR